jgi:thioredoxin
MTVLTTTSADCATIAPALADPSCIVVVALCAAWCDTCNQFRVAYEELAERRAGVTFVWLDIEDDAGIVGDIDVENFPTLAIYRGGVPLHFGVSLPHASSIDRLIDALAASTGIAAAPQAVHDLARTLLGAREDST